MKNGMGKKDDDWKKKVELNYGKAGMQDNLIPEEDAEVLIEYLQDSSDSRLSTLLEDRGSNSFDTMTLFFSVHYIFNSLENLIQLFKNIKYHLKHGGQLLVTALDGNKVYEQLYQKFQSLGKNSSRNIYIENGVEINGNIRDVWSITATRELKNFMNKNKQLPQNSKSLNLGINVEFETFQATEYLISPEYFINLARKFGLEIISRDELHESYGYELKYGTDLFKNIYGLIKGKNPVIDSLNNSYNHGLKSYSDFHRYYIFKNRSDSSFEKGENISEISRNCNNIARRNQIIHITTNMEHIFEQRFFNGTGMKNKVRDYTYTFDNLKRYCEQGEFGKTLSFLYNKIGSGIYVKIKNNILVSFIPFYNKNYENDLELAISTEKFETYEKYFEMYSTELQSDTKNNLDSNKWRKDFCKIDTSYMETNNQNIFVVLQDMLQFIVNEGSIADAEFFINLNDYPVFKKTELEYKHIPILSRTSHPDYIDIASPFDLDWLIISQKILPLRCDNDYRNNQSISWKDKKNIAVFRDSIEGCGLTAENNNRIRLACISNKLLENPISDEVPIVLDAKFSNRWRYNVLRDDKKIDFTQQVTYDGDVYDILNMIALSEENFLENVSSYKYILSVDGFGCDKNLLYYLTSGSLVLRVDPTGTSEANFTTWIETDILKSYDISLSEVEGVNPEANFILISLNPGDNNYIIKVLEWCHNHQEICKQMVQRATKSFNIDILQLQLKNYFKVFIKEASLVNKEVNNLDLQYYDLTKITQSKWFNTNRIGSIIGKGGRNKRKIEILTSTKIITRPEWQREITIEEDSEIKDITEQKLLIKGPNKGVNKALKIIEKTLSYTRKSIKIPLKFTFEFFKKQDGRFNLKLLEESFGINIKIPKKGVGETEVHKEIRLLGSEEDIDNFINFLNPKLRSFETGISFALTPPICKLKFIPDDEDETVDEVTPENLSFAKKKIAVITCIKNYSEDHVKSNLDKIVKFKQRMQHLVNSINTQSKNISMKVFIIKQDATYDNTNHFLSTDLKIDNEIRFNPGACYNIGYQLSNNSVYNDNEEFNLHIFHDIDFLPGNNSDKFHPKLKSVYTSININPKYITSFISDYTLGNDSLHGVFSVYSNTFKKVFGFSNYYWDFEDVTKSIHKRFIKGYFNTKKSLKVVKEMYSDYKYSGKQPIDVKKEALNISSKKTEYRRLIFEYGLLVDDNDDGILQGTENIPFWNVLEYPRSNEDSICEFTIKLNEQCNPYFADLSLFTKKSTLEEMIIDIQKMFQLILPGLDIVINETFKLQDGNWIDFDIEEERKESKSIMVNKSFAEHRFKVNIDIADDKIGTHTKDNLSMRIKFAMYQINLKMKELYKVLYSYPSGLQMDIFCINFMVSKELDRKIRLDKFLNIPSSIFETTSEIFTYKGIMTHLPSELEIANSHDILERLDKTIEEVDTFLGEGTYVYTLGIESRWEVRQDTNKDCFIYKNQVTQELLLLDDIPELSDFTEKVEYILWKQRELQKPAYPDAQFTPFDMYSAQIQTNDSGNFVYPDSYQTGYVPDSSPNISPESPNMSYQRKSPDSPMVQDSLLRDGLFPSPTNSPMYIQTSAELPDGWVYKGNSTDEWYQAIHDPEIKWFIDYDGSEYPESSPNGYLEWLHQNMHQNHQPINPNHQPLV